MSSLQKINFEAVFVEQLTMDVGIIAWDSMVGYSFPAPFSHSVSQPIFLKVYYMVGTVFSAGVIQRQEGTVAVNESK